MMNPRRTEIRSRFDLWARFRARALPFAALMTLFLFIGRIVANGDSANPTDQIRAKETISGAPVPESEKAPTPALTTEILDPSTVGHTKQTERSAAAGLYWLANHQMKDGNWSLQGYSRMCKGRPCTDIGAEESLSAATGLALLPFLAAGQTNRSRGPFQKAIARAVKWLLTHQRSDGDLSADSKGKRSWMYAHALATMALCECYGMSHDKVAGRAAQKAVNFIEKAQSTTTGGWKYRPTSACDPDRDRHKHFEYPDVPGDDGDMSVVAWQLMALKSAQFAGLSVAPAALERTKHWLQSVTIPGTVSDVMTYGRFSYRPGGAPSLTASAMGLWCKQALHARRDDSPIIGGVLYLLKHLPEADAPNVVYWFFANRVMFKMEDRNWDAWNRKMRATLVATQIREGCAAGSWDADVPSGDVWGAQGGRLMTTSFATLILVTFHHGWDMLHTGPSF